MGRKKIERKLLEGDLPAEMRYEEIKLLLKHYGYVPNDVPGSHVTFTKDDTIKTVAAKKGRIVTDSYLKEIKNNILRCKNEVNDVQKG